MKTSVDVKLKEYDLKLLEKDYDRISIFVEDTKKLDSIGILHNDGNCLNVMCQVENGENRIYIIDYGLAKQIDMKNEGRGMPRMGEGCVTEGRGLTTKAFNN